MLRCAKCDAPLDDATLEAGRCPACGTAINVFGEPIEPEPPTSIDADHFNGSGPTIPVEARLTPSDRLSIARAEAPFALGLESMHSGNDPPSRTTLIGLGVGLGLALLVVGMCTLAAVAALGTGQASTALAQVVTATPGKAQPSPTGSIFWFPTQVPEPTPLPFTGQIPTPEPTQTPFGGAPTPTPTIGPFPTPSPTSGSGGLITLTASPAQCQTQQAIAQFTLTANNLGPSDAVEWQAFASQSSGYDVQPKGGTLNSGYPSVQVTVNNVAGPGYVLISYQTDGKGNNRLYVSISCYGN